MTSNSRVLVSGAGIAGNAIAWLLARTGMEVVVVEKTKDLFAQGQNVDLNGAALTAIKKMSLLEEVKRKNTTERGTSFVGPKGKTFARFPQEKGSASFTNEYEILRGDLAQILYNRAITESSIEYRFGTTIEKVLENNEKIVKVQLSDGKVESFDFAVAADGQWSKLRRLCFNEEDITIVDKEAYCMYFQAPRTPEDNDWWQVYHALRSRVITIRPDPYGTARFCCTFMPQNDQQKQRWKEVMRRDRKTQEALIAEEFADAGWQADRMVKAMVESPDFYCHGLLQVKMKSWSTGRVVCVGDAGWAPTPITGQGTTLAVTGAYVLAGELEKLPPGGNPVDAFRAFDQIFHPHVDKVQNLPSFIPSIAHPASAFKRWLLQTFIWVGSYALAFPLIKQRVGVEDSEKNDDGFVLPAYPGLEAKIRLS